ncbi:MAG: hypothetical protein Q8K98_12675 [Bacteroidota bacterium]|nr:hypothetical protein [Bacteroidota bacterium]
MYKKFPLAEWAGFFMVTVMWYLYWLTVLDEKTVLFFIGSIGAYLGTLLGGTLAGIVAIRNRKLQKKIK